MVLRVRGEGGEVREQRGGEGGEREGRGWGEGGERERCEGGGEMGEGERGGEKVKIPPCSSET